LEWLRVHSKVESVESNEHNWDHSNLSTCYYDPAKPQNHHKLGCHQLAENLIFEQRLPSGIIQLFPNHPLLGYQYSCYPTDHVVMDLRYTDDESAGTLDFLRWDV
jgi:hypothetical protein